MPTQHAVTGDPDSILNELSVAWRVIPFTARSREESWQPVLAMGPTSSTALEDTAATFCGPHEIAKYQHLTMARARQTFLQGRIASKIALRAMLARRLPQTRFDPRRVEVKNDRLGRPIVQGASGLGVSLSHCLGASVAVAFPLELPLGIDLERVRPQNASVLSDWIAPDEFALAQSATPSGSHAALALTLVWCLKEALGKLLGCGLAAPPELLAITSLTPIPDGITAEYAHAGNYQGLATASTSMVLALAAPANVTLELDFGALTMG
ncbi:MAG: 4'-phosphopantetheinyl transferase superfamily protein [Desulfovibrionaceae bacterium]